MKRFSWYACITLAVVFLANARSEADLMLMTIREPGDCPKALTIKSKMNAPMVDFEIAVDPEAIERNELYRGRIHANAIVQVADAAGAVASLAVQGTKEGKWTRYQVRLSPSAAKHSELQIGVSLYEKNGRPTLGGGVSLRIHLAGFVPKDQARE